jgi:hypothetical protein
MISKGRKAFHALSGIILRIHPVVNPVSPSLPKTIGQEGVDISVNLVFTIYGMKLIAILV